MGTPRTSEHSLRVPPHSKPNILEVKHKSIQIKNVLLRCKSNMDSLTIYILEDTLSFCCFQCIWEVLEEPARQKKMDIEQVNSRERNQSYRTVAQKGVGEVKLCTLGVSKLFTILTLTTIYYSLKNMSLPWLQAFCIGMYLWVLYVENRKKRWFFLSELSWYTDDAWWVRIRTSRNMFLTE